MSNWKGIVGKGFAPADFEAYVRDLAMGEWKPQFIVLHNTSEPRLSQWHTTPGAQRMLNLQSYYRDQQGWSAGPHLFVADDLIWVFTPLTTPGVHSPSWNEVSWGVEMVGEYEDEPFDFGAAAEVRDNAVSALATLSMKAGFDSSSLHLHKEDPKTTHKDCPGKNVVKADMIQRLHDEIGRRRG
jgi:hypothetical protein